MLLRATKSLVYATRRLVPGDEFETKTRNDARILVGIRKAEYVERTPGSLPPPPPEVAAALTPQSPTPEAPTQAPPSPHPLDHDGDGRPGGSPKPDDTGELVALRAEYFDVIGKRPFHGWDEEALRQKIAEASA